jgi:hypothetical protein
MQGMINIGQNGFAFKDDPLKLLFLIVIGPFGAIFGAFFTGHYFLNSFGRRTNLFIADTIGIIGSVLFGIDLSISFAMIGRFIMGISSGINSVLVPIYVR